MITRLHLVLIVLLCVACGDEPRGDGVLISLTSVDSSSVGGELNDGGLGQGTSSLGDVQGMDVPDAVAARPPIDVPVAPVVTGTCPELSAGTNTFTISGTARSADVFLPETPAGAPVVFIWHGLGDSAGNMGRAFGASGLTNQYGAIVVVPHSSGQFPQSEWSFFGGNPAVDGDFFDEMLGCVDQAYDVDMNRIYTTGFSAGALWSTWLLMNRSEYLAAVVLFSGGAGGVNPYGTPSHDTPVLAFHGGPSDIFAGGFLNFSMMTTELAGNLVDDGHFVIVCDHNGGHRIPLDPRAYAFPFMFDHHFDDEGSAYAEGLGEVWPDFCGIRSN